MKKVTMCFVILAAAVMMTGCGGSKPYDAKKVSELKDKVFSLTPDDYAEVIKQADGILTYFEQKYPADELKEKAKGLVTEEKFGSDTELFKTFNQFCNALYNMDDQMDATTKSAYDKFLERKKSVLGH